MADPFSIAHLGRGDRTVESTTNLGLEHYLAGTES